ncbi:hypothetical protein [Agromyces badenianii]|uniref:hypothetical protein n=1 Tax=Agromyces badenianii TaxID=2080742 RepID=UPI000D591C96|nr:hypothetical protein [Agromyces badenianii]PWC05531.1 hypothetical protein DCE94_04490 [Agromyces badenianii]
MTRRPAFGGALLAALAIVLLNGCTPAVVDGTAELTPSSTPASTTEPAPSATPGAAPAATCETVLATEGYAKLADDGLQPLPSPQVFDALAARMVEAGGLACAWGKPNTDLVLTVVEIGITPADEAAWSGALGETGYVLTDQPTPGAYTGPMEPGSGISPVAVLADGTLTFVSAPTFATMLAPTA